MLRILLVHLHHSWLGCQTDQRLAGWCEWPVSWVQVVAGGQVPTDDASGAYFKGVFELDWPTNVTDIQVCPSAFAQADSHLQGSISCSIMVANEHASPPCAAVYKLFADSRMQKGGCNADTHGCVQFFAESPLTGLKLTLTDVALTPPADVGTKPNKLALPADNITDIYSPCMLPQNAGNDGVYVVSLPTGQKDQLNAVLCSPGGYYQVWGMLCCTMLC